MEKPPKREVTLKDRYSGNLVWLTVRDGVVVGAMGADPKRYLGMTLGVAKHYARYGGKPLKMPSRARATKRKTMADYDAEGYAAKTWYLAECPYTQPKIRDAWQAGAWRWQQEQRGKTKAQ